MVAGRCFWGEDEQGTAQHQPGRRGDLGVEAVVEDRPGAGEAGGLGSSVKTRRQVDKEDDGEAEQAKQEDDPPQATAPLVTDREERQHRSGQGNRDQQVGVGRPGGPCPDRGRGGGGQAGVARLADLHRAVVDELRGDQQSRRGDDGQADPPLGGEHGTGARRRPPRPGSTAQQAPFQPGKSSQDEYACGPQASPHPAQPWRNQRAHSGGRRDEQYAQPLIRGYGEGFELDAHDPHPAARRCYHRASLRLLFRSSFRRAREGLFHAPIPATLPGRCRLSRLHRFLSSPLHKKATLTLRPWHAASP